MEWLFGGLSGALVNMLVYSGIALVMLTGLVKCVFPLRRLARLFHRASHELQRMPTTEGARPSWQDVLFLGKPMQRQWQRFLINAEQLDARGIACDTQDYINDESVFTDYAHLRVSEVIPGLLTSLGILGTFIGLMRGVSGLDVTSADATMKSISQMIGGMTFAYGTSIAGLVCSLLFNILNRAAQGSATSAMDEFHFTFRELVMQPPLEHEVHSICYMEDQALFLRHSADELNNQLAKGISTAIHHAFTPIKQQMDAFIAAETQEQLHGLSQIVNHFMRQMDSALGGQFHQLAKTLTGINQSQSINFDSANQALAAADALMQNMNQMNSLTASIVERFDGYVNELAASQSGNAHLAKESSRLLSQLHTALSQQSEHYAALQEGQENLEKQMQQYASWSGRVLEAVEKQSDSAKEQAHKVANEMSASAKLLKDSYAGFVQDVSTGLSRAMSMFEDNMRDMMNAFATRLGEGADKVTDASKMQQAMGDMTAALKAATSALESGREAGHV